jgi:hypothetical protein
VAYASPKMLMPFFKKSNIHVSFLLKYVDLALKKQKQDIQRIFDPTRDELWRHATIKQESKITEVLYLVLFFLTKAGGLLCR